VYLLDAASQTLVLAAGAGEPGRAMKARGHNISFHNEHSLVAGAARSRRSVVVNDVTKSPHFLPNPLLPDTRSEMSIPLVVGERLLGVLDVQSDSTSVFTNQEVQIMTTLGDQVAVAVQNAQLYEQQTEAAEQLRAVDRLKSEFLANMSHELRTPLNSIIGYAEVMIDGIDGELPDEAIEDVQAIHDSGQHLLSMINDILDLAKIEAGRMELDLETVKLDDVAEEVRRITSVLYKDKPVELVIDLSPDLPEVWADQVRLRQIMTNLVSNAGKFTSQGEVRISAQTVNAQHSDQPDMISISVIDTGEGIAEEHLDLVFQQFRQADNSSTRKAGGTGLGLTITKHLIEMQGGHIWVESIPGQGSTFTFTVPVAKVSVAQ
jgi:signal transduction histidine kinase